MRRSPLLLCALLFACSKPADAPREEPVAKVESPDATKVEPDAKLEPDTKTEADTKVESPDAKPEPDAAKVEPAIDPAAPPRLLIANDEGLHEYDLDGKRLTTLATGAAKSPRVLADGRVVFLRNEATLELWMHTPGGETKRIAALPQRWNGEACKAELGKPGEDFEPIDLQDSGDFRLDASKQEACIRLQDRNENMVSFGVAVWVGLGDGTVRQQVTTDLEGECAKDEGAGQCYELPLERERPPAAATVFAYAYESTTGKLTGPEGSTASICRKGGDEPECAQVEERSASGRFELLSGEMDSGDYIYRELIVLDRQTGKLWAIGSGDDPKLLAVEPGAVFEGIHETWQSFPGEADVRWLAQDRLWIEGVLIDPSKPSLITIAGDLAFRLDA
jgi:hypothetical protein